MIVDLPIGMKMDIRADDMVSLFISFVFIYLHYLNYHNSLCLFDLIYIVRMWMHLA